MIVENAGFHFLIIFINQIKIKPAKLLFLFLKFLLLSIQYLKN